MSLEKQDLPVAEVAHVLDAEHIWGGEEWEWKNWEKAERHMNLEEYNEKQRQEMVSMKTREAFMAENHREPVSNDELSMFFVLKGGARWFKRRFWQYCDHVSEKTIKNYYQNKEWETKETDEHA